MTPIVIKTGERSIVPYELPTTASRQLHEAIESLCGKETYQQYACGKSSDQNDPPALRIQAKKQGEKVGLIVETSDFVGFSWVIPGLLGVRVDPKLNDETRRIDTLCMLRNALLERVNLEHLYGLVEIKFNTPPLADMKDSEGLGLFLAAMYLSLLEKIARKGLRMQFYVKEEVFSRKIKGKIIFSPTVASRRTPRLSHRLHCRYQEFSVDSLENRILKCALRVLMRFLQQSIHLQKESEELFKKACPLLRAFELVSDVSVNVNEIGQISRSMNPVFRDHSVALGLAEKILRMESIGWNDTSKKGAIPEHWIYMPKLFELYVYSKLRASLPPNTVIHYQFERRWQYLDFLCCLKHNMTPPAPPRFFIADAKYKPRYAKGNSGMVNDLRQLSGYARISGVLDEFQRQGWENRNLILPCLIIYSDQNLESEELDWARLKPILGWEAFFKIGLRLPERKD